MVKTNIKILRNKFIPQNLRELAEQINGIVAEKKLQNKVIYIFICKKLRKKLTWINSL